MHTQDQATWRIFGMATTLGAVFVALMATTANAEPVVPGKIVSIYVSMARPGQLTFDPSGVMFVGNDTNDSYVKIRRVGVGGSPVDDFGTEALNDPDAVLYDATGQCSGVPGSVIVGGLPGYLKAIRPDQSRVDLFNSDGPDDWTNPNEMAWDSTGRLVFIDYNPGTIYTSNCADPPTALLTPPSGADHFAIDAQDRIFVACRDGVIRVYAADGSLVNDAFTTGLGNAAALAFGPGGAWGTGPYVIDGSELLYFDLDGNGVVIGAGFPGIHHWLAFGPDGALYIANDDGGSVSRVVPDCNGNGIGDNQDIASGTSQDCDQDAVPDECESDCDGDGLIDDCDSDDDNDGVADEVDGCPGTPGCEVMPDGRPRLDLNNDCEVNGLDIQLIVQQILEGCSACR